MVSIWWLVATFLVGGCAGMLLIALMRMSGGVPEQPRNMPELELDLNPTQW
jgi:RsiW-degrading membrane proteinase PrsW (M82 family)